MMADEYIRREDALKLLSDDIPICGASLYQVGAKGGLQIAHGIVAAIPAADVVPVLHGRKIEDGDIGCFWLCSLCGECLPYGAKYCHNCGAKMDGENGNG